MRRQKANKSQSKYVINRWPDCRLSLATERRHNIFFLNKKLDKKNDSEKSSNNATFERRAHANAGNIHFKPNVQCDWKAVEGDRKRRRKKIVLDRKCHIKYGRSVQWRTHTHTERSLADRLTGCSFHCVNIHRCFNIYDTILICGIFFFLHLTIVSLCVVSCVNIKNRTTTASNRNRGRYR